LLSRSLSISAAASALVAGVGVVAVAPVATAAPAVRVVSTFPDDRLTVPDRSQLTGRRVALPLVACEVQVTACDVARLLNELDGFDLDPRLSLSFDRAVDPTAVAAATTVERVRGPGPALATGVDRVVYDPETRTVHAHPAVQLAASTTYRLRVRPSRGVPNVNITFTTMSATTDLRHMVSQLDSGAAYRDASIPDSRRGLVVDRVVPAAGTTLAYTNDLGPARSTTTTPVPNVSAVQAGSYVFGSYLAPTWLTRDRVIPQTPTRQGGPVVQGQERLPFVMIVPAGKAPEAGWPVAVFGHGFTRSSTDLFLAAATNATRGLATIATHVVGHGSGPRSEWQITHAGVTTTTSAYGRGIDLDGDGLIGSTEGVSTLPNPAPLGAVNSRDGLRQTVADNAALVRAVSRGVQGAPIARRGATYYGQSFGGIYGTMLGGADPSVRRLVLNVPGGPITEIARLSPAFRPLTTQALGRARPSLLNGGYFGFTESMPLAGDPPVLQPAAGAMAIQHYLAQATWLTRSGNPETYAPLLRATPPPGAQTKQVLFQAAFGDQTVPNPTSRTLLAAGSLFDRASLYRNDRTAQSTANPHSFLLNPAFAAAFRPGQTQMVAFLTTGQTVDPDGPGPVWEVPVVDPRVLQDLNFPSPLHR